MQKNFSTLVRAHFAQIKDFDYDLQARILRIKGILAIDGVETRVVVQGVGEAIEVTLGPPWQDVERDSRLVILGLALDEATLLGVELLRGGKPSWGRKS